MQIIALGTGQQRPTDHLPNWFSRRDERSDDMSLCVDRSVDNYLVPLISDDAFYGGIELGKKI